MRPWIKETDQDEILDWMDWIQSQSVEAWSQLATVPADACESLFKIMCDLADGPDVHRQSMWGVERRDKEHGHIVILPGHINDSEIVVQRWADELQAGSAFFEFKCVPIFVGRLDPEEDHERR